MRVCELSQHYYTHLRAKVKLGNRWKVMGMDRCGDKMQIVVMEKTGQVQVERIKIGIFYCKHFN